MTEGLGVLLRELELFGRTNDAGTTDRARRMLNITRETGQLLALLVRATGARRVLEIGTSNGYSTIWLAEAALATGASVTTVERSADKARMAAGNFARGGLAPVIDLVQEDAAVVLSRLADASVDLLFLDAERAEYPGWWRDLTRVLRPGGLLVADNAVSHAGEMARFRELLSDDRRFTACIVPVGNGELLAVKGSPGDPEVLEE